MWWTAVEQWSSRLENARDLLGFRRTFAFLCLAYDTCDLLFHGTASALWTFPPEWTARLPALQIGLIIFEALLCLDVFPMATALACAVLRGIEAWYFFPLNDFFYITVVMLILSQSTRTAARTPVWVRDALVAQAAWIYFATALLKLNPEWLSGGHLYVRFAYLRAVFEWPYPAFFSALASTPAKVAWLAYGGAALEFALAAMLTLRARKRYALGAALLLHGFAALTTNVWFFGAAMVAQVGWLSRKKQV